MPAPGLPEAPGLARAAVEHSTPPTAAPLRSVVRLRLAATQELDCRLGASGSNNNSTWTLAVAGIRIIHGRQIKE